MASRLRSLFVCASLIGYMGLVVERRHEPGWWWYVVILCGMAAYHLLTASRKQ